MLGMHVTHASASLGSSFPLKNSTFKPQWARLPILLRDSIGRQRSCSHNPTELEPLALLLNKDLFMRCVYLPMLLISAASSLSSVSVAHESWSRFRGPNGSGIGEKLPLDSMVELESALWKTEVGAGGSSPIVYQDRLFVSSFDKDTRSLHCLDANSGKSIWEKSIPKIRTETATPPNDPATCTPACDDKHVCALFPDSGLVVYDLEGNLKWQKDLGPFYSMHGISASPVLANGKVIVAVDQLQDPYIAAFDAESGNPIWKVERLVGITGGYSSPILANIEGISVVISAGPGELVAYDVNTGERKMTCTGLTNAPVGLPVIVQNRLYYSEPPGEPIPMEAVGPADQNRDGFIELNEVKGSLGTYRLIERIDQGFGNGDGKIDRAEWDKAFGTFLNRGGLSCVEITRKGDLLEGNVVWKYSKSTPYIPSVIVVNELAYTINDGGVLTGLDGQSGEVFKRARIKDATGQYYASPVSDGEVLVLANLEGRLSFVEAGRDFKTKSAIDFQEPILATPTLSQGKLFVRTATQLFCFGKS
jgi:outer membrane protein assembly factor BamB